MIIREIDEKVIDTEDRQATVSSDYTYDRFLNPEMLFNFIFYFVKGTDAALTLYSSHRIAKPKWHAPWNLSAVVSGHLGWVRSIAFDPANEWFVTGSSDRTIKVNQWFRAFSDKSNIRATLGLGSS